jgi:hypothetical protein
VEEFAHSFNGFVSGDVGVSNTSISDDVVHNLWEIL